MPWFWAVVAGLYLFFSLLYAWLAARQGGSLQKGALWLVVCLALLVVWELLRIRKLDKTKAPFSRRFAAPDKETVFLAAGSLLLVAGGLLMAMSGLAAAAARAWRPSPQA